MRRTVIVSVLGILAASSLAGQDRVVPLSCVPDTSEKATLTGVLALRTYPGPPNYEDTASGDKVETGIYLLLDGYACRPKPGDSVGVYTRAELEWIQLILEPQEYRQARRQLGKHVRVSGVVSPAESGHHHTLLIFVPTKPLRLTVLES